jgi:hypothetical protein
VSLSKKRYAANPRASIQKLPKILAGSIAERRGPVMPSFLISCAGSALCSHERSICEERHVNLLPSLANIAELGNEQNIPTEVDRRITCLRHVRDLRHPMLSRRSRDRNWAKRGRFPRVHLNNVRESSLARRLRDSTLHSNRHLLIGVRAKSVHVIVIVVSMADNYARQPSRFCMVRRDSSQITLRTMGRSVSGAPSKSIKTLQWAMRVIVTVATAALPRYHERSRNNFSPPRKEFTISQLGRWLEYEGGVILS